MFALSKVQKRENKQFRLKSHPQGFEDDVFKSEELFALL